MMLVNVFMNVKSLTSIFDLLYGKFLSDDGEHII